MKGKDFKVISRLLVLVMLTVALVVCVSQAEEQATTRWITDMAGRTVEIPMEVNRVICLHPIPTYMAWRLAPNKLVSVDSVFKKHLVANNFLFPDSEKKRLDNLPVTEVFFKPIDREQILALEPDVIVSMTKDPNVNKTQGHLGIPVVTVSKNTLNDYEASFRLMGKLLGNEKEGNELADYWHSVIERVTDETSQIPENERVKVYYASHDGPLSTVGPATVMASIIGLAGGINVSDNIYGPVTSEKVAVSMEQVLVWNPDVITTGYADVRDEILSSSEWKEINAVKNHRVYAQLQYEKLDGICSIMGLVWTAKTLYPEKTNFNLLDEVKAFYSKFYLYNAMTDEQVWEIRRRN
ncbi:MAG: ABC transporter substrate-binding protein [bacterium]|nr:ABC transporter substrate-binding protein [bacterium]